MICQHITHNTLLREVAWQWWHVMLGLNPGQGHIRWSVPMTTTVVRLQ